MKMSMAKECFEGTIHSKCTSKFIKVHYLIIELPSPPMTDHLSHWIRFIRQIYVVFPICMSYSCIAWYKEKATSSTTRQENELRWKSDQSSPMQIPLAPFFHKIQQFLIKESAAPQFITHVWRRTLVLSQLLVNGQATEQAPSKEQASLSVRRLSCLSLFTLKNRLVL